MEKDFLDEQSEEMEMYCRKKLNLDLIMLADSELGKESTVTKKLHKTKHLQKKF